MDGWTLLFELRESLNESSSSTYLNDQVSYGHLYSAAQKINLATAAITSSQTITTTATTSEYGLNPDYMGLYLMDLNKELFVKYNDLIDDYFVTFQPYEEVYYQNNSDDKSIPDRFTIKDVTTAVANVTGNASAGGALVNGEATLTDASIATKFATIAAGDLVHNTTSAYHGIVISKTSSTALVTAMFDENGDAKAWDLADAYIVVPQGRFALVVDPPSLTSLHTITVPYIKKPSPVFSPYRSYSFPLECKDAMVEYAAFKYKYRDREPSFGDKFYQWFDKEVKDISKQTRHSLNRGGFTMNMKGKR
jgi:hypothetical protein